MKSVDRSKVIRILLGLIFTGFVTISESNAALSFYGLGTNVSERGFDWRWTSATGVSADGSSVVGFEYTTYLGSGKAFRWRSAPPSTPGRGFRFLGSLPGHNESYAKATSADGSVVVGGSGWYGQKWQAFRWSEATGSVGLGFVDPQPATSHAHDVSADGSVVVGDSGGGLNPTKAFRWTESTGMVSLGIGSAYGVSADGSVVVGTNGEAFRWTEATGMVGLGDLPGPHFSSVGYAVSADGSVVVGQGNANWVGFEEAFRWTEATGMLGLGELPGGNFSSTANDVSADGSVVVGSSLTDIGYEGFIWDEFHGMRNLREVLIELGLGPDLAGWTLSDASGISADGLTIVGLGQNADGYNEAWIATIPRSAVIPAPGALVLASIGVGFVSWLRRRRAL